MAIVSWFVDLNVPQLAYYHAMFSNIGHGVAVWVIKVGLDMKVTFD